MVIVGNVNFPFSKTNMNCLIATLNVPYKSTDGAYKNMYNNCPISVYLNFTNYKVQPMTITVSLTQGANIQIYKNGTLLGTTSNFNYTGTAVSKGFVLNSAGAGVICSFNSYYFNSYFQYTPPANTTYGTTDVYTFYLQISYTVSSTVTPLQYIYNSPISYIVDVNTTTSTSAFTNFSYASGSADSIGYSAYSLTNDEQYAYAWNGTQAPAYQPQTSNTLWTGLYQLAVLYSNYLFTAKGIILKNTGFTNTLSWYDSDANGSGYQTLLYASNISNAFKIDMSSSKMTNGLMITGGNVNSTSQQQTWYVTGIGGNGTTVAGNKIGASTNGGAYFSNLTVNGGAPAGNFNTSTATFTASVAGTYFIQLNVFNNGTNVSGRNLAFISSSTTQPSQYCFFNEQSTTTECSFNWTTLVYLSAGGYAYFLNSSGSTTTFYYANGHTNLTITKIF